jgi:hypothetical protein
MERLDQGHIHPLLDHLKNSLLVCYLEPLFSKGILKQCVFLYCCFHGLLYGLSSRRNIKTTLAQGYQNITVLTIIYFFTEVNLGRSESVKEGERKNHSHAMMRRKSDGHLLSCNYRSCQISFSLTRCTPSKIHISKELAVERGQ